LQVNVSGSVGTSGLSSITIVVTSDQGVTREITVPVVVHGLQPVLSLSANSFDETVLRGTTKSVTLSVTNTGAAPASLVRVLLPELPFLKLTTPAQIASLAPGASFDISLVIAPGQRPAYPVHW